MALPFITRDPTTRETEILALLLSTFRDGTGNQRDADNGTRADWRQIERCFAELFNALGGEDKAIFDVVAPDPDVAGLHYGVSVKTKEFAAPTLQMLDRLGRVYMEIANSPAKFWAAIGNRIHRTEADFAARDAATEIGQTLLDVVQEWHEEGKRHFESANRGARLSLEHSCYLSLTYSRAQSTCNREFQVHAFPLVFPTITRWEYTSDKCLRGFDPSDNVTPLFDWYGRSGGQLKYYPRANTARYRTQVFKLLPPQAPRTLLDKAKGYFPDYFPPVNPNGN